MIKEENKKENQPNKYWWKKFPKSFVNNKKEEVLIDPSVVYTLPTDDGKVVKVMFEGHIMPHSTDR